MLLATPEKIGAASPFLIVPLSGIDTIIVDAATTDEVIASLALPSLSVIRGPTSTT